MTKAQTHQVIVNVNDSWETPRYCKHCKIRIVKEITHCTVCNKKVGKSSPTYDSAWVIFRKVVV